MRSLTLPLLLTTSILDALPDLLAALKDRNAEWKEILITKEDNMMKITIQYTQHTTE